MRTSETIAALAKALSAAQKEMQLPTKSKTAQLGTYSYKYADLPALKEAYREPLAKHGLAVTHSVAPVDGHIVLTSTLLHESGEWCASDFPLSVYSKPQEQGSAMTYFKRYNLSALLDLPSEDDDDGKAAQDAVPVKREEPAAAAPPSGDAGLILDLAAEIQQLDGGTIDGIVYMHSAFPGKEGKEMSFTDPTKVRSAKWLAGTRGKLESTLHKLRAKSEPGAAETAKLFKATDDDVSF